MARTFGTLGIVAMLGNIVPRSVSLERVCEAEPDRLNLLGAFLRRVLVA
jgi:hypothetical protein